MTIFYRNCLDRSRLCQRNRCIVLLRFLCWHCIICCVINNRTGGRCDRHLRAVWKLVSTGDRRNVAGARSCDLTIASCQNRIVWSDSSDVKINHLTGTKRLLRLKVLQWVIIFAIDTILIAHHISICRTCHLHNIYGSAIVWSYTHIKLNCFLLWWSSFRSAVGGTAWWTAATVRTTAAGWFFRKCHSDHITHDMTIFYRNRPDRSRLCQRNRCIVLLWSICWHCTICCVINARTGGRCDRHLRAVWKLVSTGNRRNAAVSRSFNLTIASCQNRTVWSNRSDVKINHLTRAKRLLRLKLLQWVIISAIDTILIAHRISICQICHLHNIYGSAIVWSYIHIKLDRFLLWLCDLISGFCRPGVVARVYHFRCEQSTRYTHGWHDRSCGNPQGQDFC